MCSNSTEEGEEEMVTFHDCGPLIHTYLLQPRRKNDRNTITICPQKPGNARAAYLIKVLEKFCLVLLQHLNLTEGILQSFLHFSKFVDVPLQGLKLTLCSIPFGSQCIVDLLEICVLFFQANKLRLSFIPLIVHLWIWGLSQQNRVHQMS